MIIDEMIERRFKVASVVVTIMLISCICLNLVTTRVAFLFFLIPSVILTCLSSFLVGEIMGMKKVRKVATDDMERFMHLCANLLLVGTMAFVKNLVTKELGKKKPKGKDKGLAGAG